MEEQLISFETAKLAKEKGFNIKNIKLMGYTSKFYNHKTKTLLPYGRTGKTDLNKAYYALTQSLLQKWLREEHDFHIEISLNSENPNNNYETMWDYAIYIISTNTWVHSENETHYHTFEDCKENALYKALTKINKK